MKRRNFFGAAAGLAATMPVNHVRLDEVQQNRRRAVVLGLGWGVANTTDLIRTSANEWLDKDRYDLNVLLAPNLAGGGMWAPRKIESLYGRSGPVPNRHIRQGFDQSWVAKDLHNVDDAYVIGALPDNSVADSLPQFLEAMRLAGVKRITVIIRHDHDNTGNKAKPDPKNSDLVALEAVRSIANRVHVIAATEDPYVAAQLRGFDDAEAGNFLLSELPPDLARRSASHWLEIRDRVATPIISTLARPEASDFRLSSLYASTDPLPPA